MPLEPYQLDLFKDTPVEPRQLELFEYPPPPPPPGQVELFPSKQFKTKRRFGVGDECRAIGEVERTNI